MSEDKEFNKQGAVEKAVEYLNKDKELSPNPISDMVDITEAKEVEIVLDNAKLWINVDGVCKLRIQECQIVTTVVK